ncbi:unnamed protein product [Pleuronectes platessa]|uniref:Uncharacterized protein n=1 Tax=Pleuronectes platessa TaxID=8262 RepID=A0A9N7UVP6_PLEPL|nr:unnamed protein product [Pleuronectes platessa]
MVLWWGWCGVNGAGGAGGAGGALTLEEVADELRFTLHHRGKRGMPEMHEALLLPASTQETLLTSRIRTPTRPRSCFPVLFESQSFQRSFNQSFLLVLRSTELVFGEVRGRFPGFFAACQGISMPCMTSHISITRSQLNGRILQRLRLKNQVSHSGVKRLSRFRLLLRNKQVHPSLSVNDVVTGVLGVVDDFGSSSESLTAVLIFLFNTRRALKSGRGGDCSSPSR